MANPELKPDLKGELVEGGNAIVTPIGDTEPDSGATEPQPAGTPTSVEEPAESAPTLPKARRSWGRRIVRFLVTLIVLGALGVAGYYGWTRVDERIDDNTAAIRGAEERLNAAEPEVSDVAVRVDAIIAAENVVPDRLTSVEDAIAALVAEQADLDTRLGSAESLIAGHTGQLRILDDLQKALEGDLAATNTAAARQVSQLKSMELLSRARLFLYQANYGLAEQDIVAARDLIANAPVSDVVTDTILKGELLLRLDKAAEALPDLPVAAVDDLNIAWQLLLGEAPTQGS